MLPCTVSAPPELDVMVAAEDAIAAAGILNTPSPSEEELTALEESDA